LGTVGGGTHENKTIEKRTWKPETENKRNGKKAYKNIQGGEGIEKE